MIKTQGFILHIINAHLQTLMYCNCRTGKTKTYYKSLLSFYKADYILCSNRRKIGLTGRKFILRTCILLHNPDRWGVIFPRRKVSTVWS